MPGFTSQYMFASTFQNRISEIANNTIRNRVLLMMLQSRGRILPPDGGEPLEWIVHMRNPKPRGYNPDGAPDYSAPDSKRTARLNYAMYHHGVRLNRKDLAVNKGKQQFINIFQDAIREVEDSFGQRWPEYLYQDGDNPAGAEPLPLMGFYTIYNKYVANTAAAYQGYQGKVRIVSGSYAGLTMDLGTESSEWQGPDGYDTVQSTDATLGVTANQKWWPFGQGDSAYDYWHPLIVKTASTSWGSNPAFNEVYCEEMLDFGLQYSNRVAKGDKGAISIILSATDPMLTIRKRFASTYRTMAEILPTDPMTGRPGGEGAAYGRPVYLYNGRYLVDDFDMPNNTDLIGLKLETIAYHPVHAYDQTTGATPIMEPFDGDIPGGAGKLIGGFSLGQLRLSPRDLVFWTPLV